MRVLTPTSEKSGRLEGIQQAIHGFQVRDVTYFTTVYLETGSGGQGLERLSLSAEDLVMAMHKASSRRIEVLSRTTGNVDQVGS